MCVSVSLNKRFPSTGYINIYLFDLSVCVSCVLSFLSHSTLGLFIYVFAIYFIGGSTRVLLLSCYVYCDDLSAYTHTLVGKNEEKKKNGTSASEIINKNMRNRWSACISYNILTMSIDAICILCVYYTIFGCCCRLVVTIVRTSSARQQRHTMSPIRICMLRLCVCVFWVYWRVDRRCVCPESMHDIQFLNLNPND